MIVEDLLSEEIRAGTRIVSEIRSKEILESIGIPTTGGWVVQSEEEALKLAGKIGYPVVLKIDSPDISHKTDVGGVKTNLENSDSVRNAYRKIIETVKHQRPEARIEGMTVQRMAPPGIEVIIGAITDKTFGPVVLFGMGGVFAELMKDVSFRVVPINRKDAESMIREVKGFPLLEGYRGTGRADLESLISALLSVSTLMGQCPAIIETDINPIFAGPNGIVAADARLVLKQPAHVIAS